MLPAEVHAGLQQPLHGRHERAISFGGHDHYHGGLGLAW